MCAEDEDEEDGDGDAAEVDDAESYRWKAANGSEDDEDDRGDENDDDDDDDDDIMDGSEVLDCSRARSTAAAARMCCGVEKVCRI